MAKSIGNNVKVEVNKNIATITVDLTKDYGMSKSGKSIQIASTLGNKELTNGVFIGLNVYRKEE
jgi:hypothetical protein